MNTRKILSDVEKLHNTLMKLGSSIIPGTEENVVWPAKMIRSKADAMEVGLDQFSKAKNKHYIVIACDAPRYVSRAEFDDLDLGGPGWQPQKFTRVQITTPRTIKFTVTYTAPSYWASYLINGDFSGMEDDEIATADAFLAWVGLGAPVDCEGAGFCHSNDAGTLAGDCMTYSFLRE